MGCLAEETIVDLLDGRLDEASLQSATRHLDECASCRGVVSILTREDVALDAPLVRGATVGRYVIVGPLGSGSMGTVYAAFDPELDRKVALKLLRPDALVDRSASALRARLLREAQTLAKLSHPNVVTVHDVGRVGNEVFIAMELVEGSTLTEWLAAKPRTRAEILAVLRHAGEGLAAAHDAGIIHRDFKPENVLIGKDGRVRVGDFGLARAFIQDVVSAQAASAQSQPSLLASATATGALVGTPAYMAPEQWEGRPVDARTDVFGFSVTLFEAIHGTRPFSSKGATPETIVAHVREAKISYPAGPSVPAWLRQVVARGLAFDPEARWPTMRAMLDALARGPRFKAGRVLGAAAALALLPLAFVAARSLTPRRPPVCTGAAAAWGDAWGPQAKEAVRTAFARTGRAQQALAFEQVAAALDDFRARWTAMHTDACMATRVRGEQSETLLDLRMGCLDDRRKEIAALSRTLAAADGATVDRWSNALGGLRALDTCANPKALMAPVPPPSDPAARARVDELSTRLAEAKALDWVGRYREAKEAAAAIADEASALPYVPLVARARYVQGSAEQRLGLESHATLHAAATSALDGHDDATAADAWILLVRVEGLLERPEEAQLWADYAAAALARLGGDDEREATRLRNLATSRRQDDQRAVEWLTRARALYERSSREPLRTFYLSNVEETLGAGLFFSGRVAEALASYERTEVARTRLFGPDHLSVAYSMLNEGDCLLALGRLDDALAKLDEAGAILTSLRTDAYLVQRARASVLRRKGAYDAALAEDTRAAADCTVTAGRDQVECTDALTGLGEDLLGLARPKEAIAPLERALALRDAGTPNARDFAATHFALARALFAGSGDRTRARSLASAARDRLAPFAERYGSFYAASLAEVDAWLAHPG